MNCNETDIYDIVKRNAKGESKIGIREISAEETWDLRHKVMWPEKDIEFVKLQDDPLGKHFGLFVSEDLVSVISLFEKNNIIQFRKFATLQKLQGKGYGSMLLDYVVKEAERQGVTSFWCNARVNKIEFYKKFGLKVIEEAETKDRMKYVKMSKTF